MPWFKVDDRFHAHPKALAVSLAALGPWTAAGSWSSANCTGGEVPDHVIPLLSRGSSELADELVRAGLWRRIRGGYRFHDWDDFNPNRDEAAAKSSQKSIAGALGNHRRWHVGLGVTDPNCTYCQKEHPPSVVHDPGNKRSQSDRSCDSSRDRNPNPPVPTRSNENKSSSNSRRGAGTPDDDEGTSQLNPTVGAAVAVLARHDLDQRQTAPGQPPVADPAAWERRAYKRRMEAHRSALEAFLADDPTLTPEKLAERVLGPSRGQSGAVNGHPAANGHSDPLAGIQAAARARAERHLRVIHGQACTACNDTGWRLDPDSNEAVPCPHQTAQEAR